MSGYTRRRYRCGMHTIATGMPALALISTRHWCLRCSRTWPSESEPMVILRPSLQKSGKWPRGKCPVELDILTNGAAGLKGLCMASADTAQDVTTAAARGWRSFRVRKHTAPVLASEAICPASHEGGQRTQCDSCGLCAGASIKARSIVIADHGLMDARRAERRAA